MVSAEFVERCLPLLGIKNCFSHKRKEKSPRRNGIEKKKETLSRTVSAYTQPKHRSTHAQKKKREKKGESLAPSTL